MRPIQSSVTLAAASANNICTSQTIASAGALTLNGSTVSGGVAQITPAGTPVCRQVLITSGGSDESGKTFTVVGTVSGPTTVTETLAGPTAAGTVTTTNYFQTVTSISVSAALAGNVTVGTNGVGGSRPIALDTNKRPFAIGLGATVTGTINYTSQYTFDDLNTTTNGGPVWIDHSTMASKTANFDSNIAFPVRGTRVKVNSGTGAVVYTVIQGG